MRAFVAALLLAAAVLAACDSEDRAERRTPRPAQTTEPPRPPPPGITRAELNEHLVALQEIADRSGGTRAAGTPGDAASAEYAAARFRDAGFRVRLQPVRFTYFDVRRARVEIGGRRLRRRRHFEVLSYSGSGRARGTLASAGDGCSESDFAFVDRGELPLVERGGCFFREKARLAQAHGARALVVRAVAGGARGIASGTLAGPGIRIPVLLIAAGNAQPGAAIELHVTTEAGPRRTQNVIAETPNGRGRSVVMAGGHLDSVAGGPGINDNGSGVATLIEAAEALGAEPPGARVRLALWGAEELGLVGSRRYVGSLGRDERRRIAAYLNLDSVGSPNAVPQLYADGDARLARLLQRVTPETLGGVGAGSSSDHAPFHDAGIPINGLYTGSAERGPGARPRDPCYHLSCDTVENVDRGVLLGMARAAAEALERLSRRQAK